MAVIKVSPDMLQSRASEVRGFRSDHEQTIQRLTNLINGLNDVWTGDAQNAFVERYRSMEATFKNFSEMLEGYAKLMDTAANQLRETDQSLKGTMNSFG